MPDDKLQVKIDIESNSNLVRPANIGGGWIKMLLLLIKSYTQE